MKRIYGVPTRETVAMALHAETGKLIGTVAKAGGVVFRDDVAHVTDEVGKALAGVTIVTARLAWMYGLDFRECVRMYAEVFHVEQPKKNKRKKTK